MRIDKQNKTKQNKTKQEMHASRHVEADTKPQP